MRLAILLLLISISATGQGLRFVENKGQWNNSIDFQAQVPGGRVGVSAKGLSIMLLDMDALDERHLADHDSHAVNESDGHLASESIDGHYFTINLSGANANAKALVETPLPVHYNYFLGADSCSWASNALAY